MDSVQAEERLCLASANGLGSLSAVTPVVRSECTQLDTAVEPFQVWRTDAQAVWALFYRVGSQYLLRFPGWADFIISGDGLSVEVFPAIGVADETIRHLYLNQALPLAVSRQMRLVLHGSAVEIGDSVVAFLGRSGLGKSTLAAGFAADGFRFLTDDGLMVSHSEEGGYLVQPSHPSIRLWEDSRRALMPDTPLAPAVDFTSKSRLLAGTEIPFCETPLPLKSVYVLEKSNVDGVVIEAVSRRDAVIQMVKNCFLLDVDESVALRHHYGQLLSMANQVPFFRLDYPRAFDFLPQVRDAVIRHALRAHV